MKRFSVLIIAVFMTWSFSIAQIIVSDDTISMSKGLNHGFTIDLPNTTPKDLEKDWIKHLKEYKGKKTKYNKKTKEYFTDNAKIKMMSSNTVDIYTIIAPTRGGTKIMVCYDLGGAFLSTTMHPESAKVGKQILYDFAVKIKKEQAKQRIEERQDQLKDLENDMKKLEKDEDGIRKSIEDLKDKIAKLEQEVKDAKAKQAEKLKAIEDEKKAIEKAKKEMDNIR